jgi:hypothetical protein
VSDHSGATTVNGLPFKEGLRTRPPLIVGNA